MFNTETLFDSKLIE